MIWGITLILLGILAVPSLILSKKPNAKELLDKIAPYQGWIGLAFCVWGLWGIISALLNLRLIGYYPIIWLTLLVASLVMAVLGFILGYGTISQLVLSKNEEARKKGEELMAKLTPLQGKIGIASIVIGIWTIVASFLFYV